MHNLAGNPAHAYVRDNWMYHSLWQHEYVVFHDTQCSINMVNADTKAATAEHSQQQTWSLRGVESSAQRLMLNQSHATCNWTCGKTMIHD